MKNPSEFTDKEINQLEIFCKSVGDEPAAANMTTDMTVPGSLWSVLFEEKRFDHPNGIFGLLYEDDKIIAMSGAYRADFCQDIVIGGVRTYTLKEYRKDFLHGSLLIPKQIEWAVKNEASAFALTFNHYNRWLWDFIRRINCGGGVVLGKKVPDSLKEFTAHPKPCVIKHTKQWICWKRLNEKFKYDWREIEDVSI
ncbi:MAG: hypothetical protein WC284_15365 [Candidimonas sp.]